MGLDDEQHKVTWRTVLSLAIKLYACLTIPPGVVGMPRTVKLALMRANQGESLIVWVCSGTLRYFSWLGDKSGLRGSLIGSFCPSAPTHIVMYLQGLHILLSE